MHGRGKLTEDSGAFFMGEFKNGVKQRGFSVMAGAEATPTYMGNWAGTGTTPSHYAITIAGASTLCSASGAQKADSCESKIREGTPMVIHDGR
jgi:hypothetical protein